MAETAELRFSGVWWLVSVAAAGAIHRPPGGPRYYSFELAFQAAVGSIFFAVLFRFIYVRIFARRRRRPVRSLWLLVLALAFALVYNIDVPPHARNLPQRGAPAYAIPRWV